MSKTEAMAYVGSIVCVLSTEHLITRYDASRQQFRCRNIRTKCEDVITADDLALAVRDKIATIHKRR